MCYLLPSTQARSLGPLEKARALRDDSLNGKSCTTELVRCQDFPRNSLQRIDYFENFPEPHDSTRPEGEGSEQISGLGTRGSGLRTKS